MKKLLFAAVLLSLALLGGCAKGGDGPCAVNCPGVDIEPQINKVGLNVSVPLTLQFNQYTTPSPVNWTIQPASCGSACGTLTNVTTSTATYVAPSSVPSNPSFSIVAMSQTDGNVSGSLPLTVIPVTANVAPVAPNVGAGLTQQYTAVALPEQAPQTFTWTCTTPNGPCANFSQDPNISGLAYYKPTAGEECGTLAALRFRRPRPSIRQVAPLIPRSLAQSHRRQLWVRAFPPARMPFSFPAMTKMAKPSPWRERLRSIPAARSQGLKTSQLGTAASFRRPNAPSPVDPITPSTETTPITRACYR